MKIEPSADALRIANIPARVNHVHLMGVAGSAMTGLAGMLKARGLHVTGSDHQIYEPAASLLKQLAVEVRASFAPGNLVPPPDLVVVGNVITSDNPEARALLASAIPYVSMPEALWHFFLDGRRVLMVAGTHGKTTSTAMMAQVLAAAGRDPSLMVGGLARNFGANYRLGAGPDFVIEGDEYDTAFFDKGPKFLHYHPHGAIITAVEFDHADIYRDLDHVKTSFRALATRMSAADVLAVCADFPHALEIASQTQARRVTFGLKAGAISAAHLRLDRDGARFTITRDGAVAARQVRLPIGGRMNVANALGVFALLSEFAVSAEEIAAGLATFSGVARRQEIVAEAAGVIVIDDFAHHPTAIAATLEAVAERFGGRILAAFEPRSNTARRGVFQAGFATAFDRASEVYLAPVYFKENDPIPDNERLDIARLAAAISQRGPRAAACASGAEILDRMLEAARPGDVALFMSNGPFDNLTRCMAEALRVRG
ncbi:MAG: UDP-N-acetylmuramate--L-alanine ligase [Candidatus Binataceae bacterium]